jgi:hypothetical protein
MDARVLAASDGCIVERASSSHFRSDNAAADFGGLSSIGVDLVCQGHRVLSGYAALAQSRRTADVGGFAGSSSGCRRSSLAFCEIPAVAERRGASASRVIVSYDFLNNRQVVRW